jgi:hypothetical protein
MVYFINNENVWYFKSLRCLYLVIFSESLDVFIVYQINLERDHFLFYFFQL